MLGLGMGLTSGARRYLPESEGLFGRMSVAPAVARRGVIDDLMRSLKLADIIGAFDAFYVLAAHSEQAGRLNWVSTQYALTPIGAPAFTADRGFAGNGSSSCHTTGFNPATAVAPKFVQDSGFLGLGSLTTGSEAVVAMGNSNSIILPRSAADTFLARVNGSTNCLSANASGSGRFYARRVGTQSSSFKSGAVGANLSEASVAVDSNDILVGGRGGVAQFSTRLISFACIGRSLSDAQVSEIDAALARYLAAVGAA